MKRICIFLLFLAISLTGCSSADEADAGPVEEVEVYEPIPIEDLDDAWNTILTHASKNFVGNHPVDEGFLYYVTARYGNEAVKSIARMSGMDSPEAWHDCTGKSIHVLWYEYCKRTGIQGYDLDAVYVYDTSADNEIVMDFIGDFTLAEGVGTTMYMDQQMNGIVDCFSDELTTELHAADIFVLNNEFTYTTSDTPVEGKGFTFKANPHRAELLNEMGVDLVSLANNHVFDYQEQGLTDTLTNLAKERVKAIGAGENVEEASKPAYFIAGGYKISIVSATQIERTLNYTREATFNQSGVLKCLKPQRFVNIIKEAKSDSDFCIVYVHWGTEGSRRYGADQETLARLFTEAGADVIIGGHTHCLQTVEYMDDVPIYYSLGNFLFSTTAAMPADYETCIAQLRIKDGDIEAYFLPCYFSAGRVFLLDADDDRYTDILASLNGISDTAFIDYSGRISKKQIEE